DGKLRTEMEQRIGDGHGSSSLMADGKDDKGREAGSVCAFNFLLGRLLWQFLWHGGFFSGREQVSQCEYEKIRTGADHGNARLRYSPGEQDGANNGNETGDGTCRAQRRAKSQGFELCVRDSATKAHMPQQRDEPCKHASGEGSANDVEISAFRSKELQDDGKNNPQHGSQHGGH